MTWRAKGFVAVAIMAGICYGATAKDRDRWLAAIGISQTSAAKLRMENDRRRFLERQAAEQARWRNAAQAIDESGSEATSLLSREELCAGLSQREAMLNAQGEKLDPAAENLKHMCEASGRIQ